MKLNKGDVILICILIATGIFFIVNEYNIINGFSQFDGNFTTLFGLIFGGELLTFAIYRIGMAKYDTQKTVTEIKYDPTKNTVAIDQIERDIQEIEKGQSQDEQVS